VAARRPDGELVAESLAGSHTAFGELVARYEDAVLGIALARLSGAEEARDAAQEAFIKAYLNLASLRDSASFGSWICRIAEGTALDFARRTRREMPLESDFSAAPAAHEAAESDVGVQMREALSRLSEPTRRALILHYVSGCAHAEVAGVLGTTPGAVRTRLSRAKARLRREMVAMVEDSVKATIAVFTCLIRVHSKRSSFAAGTASTIGPAERRGVAEYTYDACCLDGDLAGEPGWTARQKEAAGGVLRYYLDDAIEKKANGLTVALEGGGLRIGYVTGGARHWGWGMTSGLQWPHLRRRLVRLATIRLQGRQGNGSYVHRRGDRAYRVRVALSASSARIAIRKARRRGADASAAGPAKDAVSRIIETILEQALRDDAKAVRIAVGRGGSRIEARLLMGGEWQDLMRLGAEIKLPGRRRGSRGSPVEHPLWHPLRERLAEMAGIVPRAGARRQTGHFGFRFSGKDHRLKTAMTKSGIRIELGCQE